MCYTVYKIMCATVIGKICASDHALNAVEEMSALNEGLKKFFEAHHVDCPNYRKLEKDAGKNILFHEAGSTAGALDAEG